MYLFGNRPVKPIYPKIKYNYINLNKNKVNWETNVEICCSLGMQPIQIISKDEQICLKNLTSKNWNLNLNYWTGGTTRGCKDNWSWCTSDNSLGIADDLIWESGSPNSNVDCVSMKLKLKTSEGPVLVSRNCTDRFVYACEVSCKLCLLISQVAAT
jgi:hypothetical protein